MLTLGSPVHAGADVSACSAPASGASGIVSSPMKGVLVLLARTSSGDSDGTLLFSLGQQEIVPPGLRESFSQVSGPCLKVR